MNPIPNGVYDVKNRQRREFWEDDMCWLYVKASTIARIIKRRNAGLSDRIALPFGHFPDLPAAESRFELPEDRLIVGIRMCLCGAPGIVYSDDSRSTPCGH